MKLSRSRVIVFSVGFVLSAVIIPAAAAQAPHSTDAGARGKLGLAADTTLRAGKHAKIPPHLSTLLGLSKEEESPVIQEVVRTGTQVQGIDVSVANNKDIVLFVVDETANDQNLYLSSPDGTLRKLVAVKAGVGAVARVTEKDKGAFNKERRFWIDRLVPPGAAR